MKIFMDVKRKMPWFINYATINLILYNIMCIIIGWMGKLSECL